MSGARNQKTIDDRLNNINEGLFNLFNDMNTELTKTKADLVECQNNVNNLTKQFKEKLAKKEEKMKNQSQKLSEKDKQIENLLQKLSEKDEQISKYKKETNNVIKPVSEIALNKQDKSPSIGNTATPPPLNKRRVNNSNKSNQSTSSVK